MALTAGDLMHWLGTLLWPMFRVTSMLMVAPIFSSPNVPARVRLGLGLAITVLLVPALPRVPALDVFAAAGFLMLVQQVLVGLLLGFALKLVFGVFELAGTVIATQMGLGFAAVNDPQSGGQIPVLSQFYLILATLVFLGLDGHLHLIRLVADSFEILPVGTSLLSTDSLWRMVERGGTIFAGAVGVALPAIASLTVVNVALGVMTRAAPQLNVFAVGFPISLVLGLLVLLYGLPALLPQMRAQFDGAFRTVATLLGVH